MSLLLTYKTILIKAGILVSFLGIVYWHISDLKNTIATQFGTILTNQITITNLQAELYLAKLNSEIDVGSATAQTVSDKAKDDILSLKDLAHEVQEKNTTSPLDDVLNGMFFKSTY